MQVNIIFFTVYFYCTVHLYSYTIIHVCQTKKAHLCTWDGFWQGQNCSNIEIINGAERLLKYFNTFTGVKFT